MKDLEYLSLAINNISVIENLQNCEKLKKLDLTLNFIDIDALEVSVQNLKLNPLLADLTLTGNPFDKWSDARPYIIAHLSSLQRLDGNDITKSERLKALQRINELDTVCIVLVVDQTLLPLCSSLRSFVRS